MKTYLASLPALLLLLAGCKLFMSETDDSRIILTRGIDGVHFGDSRETVEAKFGKPGSIGTGSGLRAWYIYVYSEGPQAGLQVRFAYNPDNTFGPVDYLVVRLPFEGKTKHGIGIGSKLE
jgi:hypothetical protein